MDKHHLFDAVDCKFDKEDNLAMKSGNLVKN